MVACEDIVVGRQGIETQYAFEFYTTDSGQRMDEGRDTRLDWL